MITSTIDNQDSQQQLNIPNVDPAFCENGTQAQFLQAFIDQVLANATVTGTSTVTQEQIEQIEVQLQSLQNQIDSITKATRTGTFAISTGDNNNAISFSSAMPSALYDIGIEFIDTGGAGNSAIGWSIVSGTQTAGGISIRTYDIPASVASANYWVRQR